MKKLLVLIAASGLLFGLPALADSNALMRTLNNGCVQYTLCSAEADTTAACDANGDNIVARLAGNYVQTLYATQSTSSAFTCHLYSSDNGYSATLRQQITSAALSESQYVITIEGPLDYQWIECSAIDTTASTSVTITSLACPIR